MEKRYPEKVFGITKKWAEENPNTTLTSFHLSKDVYDVHGWMKLIRPTRLVNREGSYTNLKPPRLCWG